MTSSQCVQGTSAAWHARPLLLNNPRAFWAMAAHQRSFLFWLCHCRNFEAITRVASQDMQQKALHKLAGDPIVRGRMNRPWKDNVQRSEWRPQHMWQWIRDFVDGSLTGKNDQPLQLQDVLIHSRMKVPSRGWLWATHGWDGIPDNLPA